MINIYSFQGSIEPYLFDSFFHTSFDTISAEPSVQDNLITNKIREAGNLLDIKLLDHIIVGDSEYYSYDEKRLCTWREQYEKVS